MTEKRKLVMATNNAGKLREARAIAGDRLEILSLEDIGYSQEIEETADTLEGNALLKVRAIKEATGLDCFADDTGLMVDALGGAPGVHTARYAGEDCNPDRNIELMLKNMQGVTDRRARFRTCVALSLDGEEHTFEGAVEGKIATERSGSHGFGYDPVFIPEETGVCFAEMTDEAKNAISHRGRAITAMMKWLSALCVAFFAAFPSWGAISSDWMLFNTFDDKIDNVFDTPDKTYFIVQSQLYNKSSADNDQKLDFVFCLEKESGEIRPYNTQNFLSRSLVGIAAYNARKRYLMLVYDDFTIDLLYDNGDVYTVNGLKNYTTSFPKEVTSISFDPVSDRAYLATAFGFVVINDKKYEVASSGIYNEPIQKIARVADRLLIVKDGKLYSDNIDSRHISLDDFSELDWDEGCAATDLAALSPTKCIVSKMIGGTEQHYILTFTEGVEKPEVVSIGSFQGAAFAENKDGLVLTRTAQIVQVDRETGECQFYPRMDGDYAVACGSWDLRDIYYAKSRKGFYSEHRAEDNSLTLTREEARPNAPAVFRSNAMMYTPQHGVLANTHGTDQNFGAFTARNPQLLSGWKNGEWSMYGVPYLDPANTYRIINPCGMAQDPDDPDVFYFGSINNGLLRYNIKDMSSILHMTRSNESPNAPGHVSLQDPYKAWGNVFFLLNPKFDSYGNLVVAHLNTENKKYEPEIWIWTKENRQATTSPETFRPFIRLPLGMTTECISLCALPLNHPANKDMILFFSLNKFKEPVVAYDHNGTPDVLTDDRKESIKTFKDSDGEIKYSYIYHAMEDPATGLVWICSDEGVFTLNPKDIFTDPGKVSRIKVSRNDGTSLADYLLNGSIVNNITIDGIGRKWFSLSGGGLVCTSSDGKTILQEINSDNSMLPSDQVYASCYNPDNNSLMIATSAGLCEYYLNGQSNEAEASEIRAYPNPVRHDYYGWVTIDGLEEDCIVKIADSAGNIVRELGPASGGKVQWDVCGMDLNRVPSGVYFVLTNSGRGGGSYHEATKILVINR